MFELSTFQALSQPSSIQFWKVQYKVNGHMLTESGFVTLEAAERFADVKQISRLRAKDIKITSYMEAR